MRKAAAILPAPIPAVSRTEIKSMRMRRAVLAIFAVLGVLVGLSPAARAADDTARFYGTWKTTVPYNGQTITLFSVHNANGYSNFVVTPNGNTPAGSGTFSAANGHYTAQAPPPNDSGTYRFLNSDTMVCTNAAGQTATWKRANMPVVKPAPAPAPSPAPGPAQPQGPAPGTRANAAPSGFVPDPHESALINAAGEAMSRKDYKTAWADFTQAAQQGDSSGEAGLGAMLFYKTNPPGTGFYAQAEKWLLASATHGNVHGMDILAQFYYRGGVNIAGGINPGVNNAPIPPALQAQADVQFAKARSWFEKSAAKGDGYAMGNLAIMLDAGVGGPRDPARAQQVRAQMNAANSDANYVKKQTTDTAGSAMTVSWMSGHYADAIKAAQAAAAKGDANAEALLGRAYYEGLGVPQNRTEAKKWLTLAVNQNQPDAMFFLGLMEEYGRGVPQNVQGALALFDRAAALGQHYADMEAAGMRMQGEAAAQAARSHGGAEGVACATAGGVSVGGGECVRGGSNIDPFNATQNEEN
jgi:TPR repeat protein